MSQRAGQAKIRDARPVIVRLFAIHRALETGECPSAAEIANRLEVSARTVERDLEQLRDFFGAPLIYDRFRRGYRYERPFSLPRASLTAGELAVLLIGQRLLAETAGTPFAGAAQKVIGKLPLLLGEEVSVDPGEISFGLPKVRGDRRELEVHFDLLSEAIASQRTVRMKYYAVTRDETLVREVDPYHLRLEAGAWYVIGYCHLRRDLRIFAVDRIEELELTGKRFERASSFTIEQYLGLSWGIESGPLHRVRVAFDPSQSRWIRERIWHEGQRLTETQDGGVILDMQVSGLQSIKRWILGFGRHARVLEPPELVRMVREEAEGILREGG